MLKLSPVPCLMSDVSQRNGNHRALTLTAVCIYSTLSVEGIINQWVKELHEDLDVFAYQAERVSLWDDQLRENQKVKRLQTPSLTRLLQNQL